MADTHPSTPPSAPKPHGTGALLISAERVSLDLFKRIYALALILLILYVSYRAVRYLVLALITPSETPAQISSIPKRLDADLITHGRPDFKGLFAVDHPRSPLAHYHRIDTWLQRDDFNGCTRSGCHSQLPHANKKEDRAFLNMHATSVQCGVCHLKQESDPLAVGWYDLRTGRASNPPALLRAFAWLDQRLANGAPREYTVQDQSELVALLRESATEGNDDPQLRNAADHLFSVRAGSEMFRRLVENARETVIRSMRGAYGAKLAVHSASGKPMLDHPGTEAAIREFLRKGAGATPSERTEMLKRIHPLRREKPLACSACHTVEKSLMPWESLGYPTARVKALHDPAIFQMIEHIAGGKPFYLPTFVGASTSPATAPAPTGPTWPGPTTQPATQPSGG